MPAVSDELRAIAASFLRRERDDHTLQPTALVHEAYLRLIDNTVVADADRDRFLGFAARAMRQVLVDHARKVRAQKRGGDAWRRVTLHPDLASAAGGEVDLVELNDVLEKFERVDPRACRVVEMHFFAGMGFAEVAGVLGVTERTVLKDWSMARAWLGRELRATGDA